MKTITGSPARKDKFFKRPASRSKILSAISNGENLLISAPRRVGKSSILLDIIDTPVETLYPVFIDTEAIEDTETFFKIILQAILDADRIEGFRAFSKKDKEKLTAWVNRISELKLWAVGIKLDKPVEQSFYEKFVEFLRDINLEGKKILLMIDEFPITVENIQHKHGLEAAANFLGQNRAIRQNPLFQDKIKFIYTGSIGLFTAVKKISATDKINDLREIKITPLKKEEATLFFNELMQDECNTVTSEDLTEYVLQRIEWWIPFYFQMLVREISHLLEDGEVLTVNMIDIAFSNVIKNGNIYFEHFKSRLGKIFKKHEELLFVNALLLLLTQQSWLPFNEIINLANNPVFNVLHEVDNILEVLKYDGYIVEQDKKYNFYSPILKAWWK